MRLIHQTLQVVDESVPAVLGVLVVAPNVNRLLRTYFLAVPAEDAAEFIDLEDQWISVPFFVFPGDQLDAIRRTYGRTKAAGDTTGLPRLGRQHSVCAAPARRDRRFLLRILDRHSPVDVEQMLHRQRHSLERGADVADVIDWPLDHLHCNCHYLPASAATGRCLSSRRSRSISLVCIL